MTSLILPCGLRMLMLDVRNAIANILDRYTLANVVEVTLRKMRSNKVIIPFVVKPSGASRVASTASKQKLTKAFPESAPIERGLGEFLNGEGI